MAKYQIIGGNKLNGSVTISGNKNSLFPCVAACLLTNQPVVIKNIPEFADAAVLFEILKLIGVRVEQGADSTTFTADQLTTHKLPDELMVKLRGSVVLVGGLLARFKKAEFVHPGGDVIGKRSIEAHLSGFEALGFRVKRYDLKIGVNSARRAAHDIEYFLDEASVTATENLILTAATMTSKVTLKNCASEPHIIDLCQMLTQMGVKIEGIGSSTLIITGKQKLTSTEFSLCPDYVEIGTYAVAAAITGGEISLQNCSSKNIESVIYPLQKMGLNFQEISGGLKVSARNLRAIPKLHTNIWPGFPTDLMSAIIVLATQARGVSLLHDWMYESRFFFVDKLIAMGANITIADPHRVVVYGPSKLVGRQLETPDIRAGMALVLAALVAKGESIINRAELIERGYVKVVENLQNLGANIQRLD